MRAPAWLRAVAALAALGVASACERSDELAAAADRLSGGPAGASAEAEAARQRLQQAASAEATVNLSRLANAAVAYFQREQVSANGDVLQPQFPGAVPRTPPAVPCGEPTDSRSAVWSGATWQALQFSTPEPHWFSYQFDSYGEGESALFYVWAFSDLDCDGVVESQHRVGRVRSGSVVVDEAQREGYSF
jgi:hypothetical protein